MKEPMLRGLALVGGVLVLILMAAAPCWAATVSGKVIDVNGAAIANAKITIMSLDQTKTTTSSGNGAYAFVSLPAGRYIVTVNASGYFSEAVAWDLSTSSAGEV